MEAEKKVPNFVSNPLQTNAVQESFVPQNPARPPLSKKEIPVPQMNTAGKVSSERKFSIKDWEIEKIEKNTVQNKNIEEKPSPDSKESGDNKNVPDKKLSDREVLIHTASLWKNKPIPLDEPEPFPEVKTESANVGKFHVTGARVRGKKHKHEGTNSDDWFETADIDKFTICAVSDGAGSRKFSRIGAKAACLGAINLCLKQKLIEYIEKNPNIYSILSRQMSDPSFQNAVTELVRIARTAVRLAQGNVQRAYDARKHKPEYEKVVGRPLELHDFASTFLLTIATYLEDIKETFIISCQVGDGMTCAIDKDAPYENMVTLLGEPDSGEFSGETEFLTSSSIDDVAIQKRTRVARKKVDYIFSMTDGVADDYDPNKVHMLRLYLDLKVNRIIDSPEWEKLLTNMDDIKRYELGKKIPAPITYPKPNGESSPVQYSGELLSEYNIKLKELWENHQADLALMASTIKPVSARGRGQRLFDWLDDYVVRGSFDDRTLVILEKGGR